MGKGGLGRKERVMEERDRREGGGVGRGREGQKEGEREEGGNIDGKEGGERGWKGKKKVEGRRERREEGTTRNQPPALYQKRPQAPSGVTQQLHKPCLVTARTGCCGEHTSQL